MEGFFAHSRVGIRKRFVFSEIIVELLTGAPEAAPLAYQVVHSGGRPQDILGIM